MKLWLLHFAFNIRYFGALSEVVMMFLLTQQGKLCYISGIN